MRGRLLCSIGLHKWSKEEIYKLTPSLSFKGVTVFYGCTRKGCPALKGTRERSIN